MQQLTKRDIERLQVFADLLAVSLRRAILLEKLERHRQELEEAMRRKNELLRIVAHDLRNPINTIAVAASILETNPPSEIALRKLYEIIDRSAKRMNRLIHDLLDEAVIERSGSLPIKPQPHPASSLAEEICELSRVQARAKTVHVECQIQGKAMVYADRDRILQVLTNLIDNALKFTPPGGRITVRSEVHNDHVRFSISDTGLGIPEEYREKIFEPYFQAPEAAHLGSGLGLAISKQIVEQHGGSIWAESNKGAGATFTFTLPAKPVLILTEISRDYQAEYASEALLNSELFGRVDTFRFCRRSVDASLLAVGAATATIFWLNVLRTPSSFWAGS